MNRIRADRTLHAPILLLILLLILIGACTSRINYTEALETADSLMEEDTDSAISILQNIDKDQLSSSRDKAKYALLMSMALDKQYIDTTEFNVLQPAIDYYLKNGTPDDKLKTLYYQGRIYWNRGDKDAAMECFIKAADINLSQVDELAYARVCVAQACLLFEQYKTDQFVNKHLKAAELYNCNNKRELAFNSYARAFEGAVIQGNKSQADSLLQICRKYNDLIQQKGDNFFPIYIIYLIHYGSNDQLRSIVDSIDLDSASYIVKLNSAYAYSKLGNERKASEAISGLKMQGGMFDSLKYIAINSEVLELQHKYKEALDCYKQYVHRSDEHQTALLSHNLWFAEEQHRLELIDLENQARKDRIIYIWVVVAMSLLMIIGLIFFLYRLNRSKRLIAEERIDRMRLKQEQMIKEKELLRVEKEKAKLEIENLRLEKGTLLGEQNRLKELLEKKPTYIEKPMKDIIVRRLEILNSLLARDLTNNSIHGNRYNAWIAEIREKRKDFMSSTTEVFGLTHPDFMGKLRGSGLTDDEINYVCLYAIGLNGKEVGEFINLKRHYNVSTQIRRKLKVPEDKNLGPYILSLVNPGKTKHM